MICLLPNFFRYQWFHSLLLTRWHCSDWLIRSQENNFSVNTPQQNAKKHQCLGAHGGEPLGYEVKSHHWYQVAVRCNPDEWPGWACWLRRPSIKIYRQGVLMQSPFDITVGDPASWTFSNVFFLEIKMYFETLKQILFDRVLLIIPQHWSRYWLGKPLPEPQMT